MLEANLLENIINPEHIRQINKECLQRGFTNLRLYKTIFTKDKDYIHFLVADPEYSISPGKELNLFTLSGLEDLIGKKLNCKVKLVLESQLKESYKEEACSQNAVAYRERNEEELKKLFLNQIIPFSIKGYTDFPKPSPTQPMSSYSQTTRGDFSQQAQTLITQLKEIPSVWEQMQNNPDILLEVRSIITAENLTLSSQPYRQQL